MENTTKKYWKGLEELNQDSEFLKNAQNEFDRDIPVEDLLDESNGSFKHNRRDFLKFLGFGVGAATLAACQKTPVKYAMPYINKPNEVIPGQANWYASAFFDGMDYNSVLVKTREGRPIKIEGNKQSPITKGAVGARAQASVLSLYDNNRLKAPKVNGKEVNWVDVDTQLAAALSSAGTVYLVTNSNISPSTNNLISDFAKKYKAKVVYFDAISSHGILSANEKCFEKRVIPAYNFEKAKVIVSFNADFLGTWLSSTEYIRQYSDGRRLLEKKEMSRHYQFETTMSLTGCNADKRIPMKPSQEGGAVLALYNAIASKVGGATLSGPEMKLAGNMIEVAANDLVEAKGASLVVSGSNDVNVQILVNAINSMLDNYGKTIDLDNYSKVRSGNDADFENFVNNAGSAGAIIFYGVNPVYSYYGGKKLADAIKGVATRVSFSMCEDETSKACNFQLPDNHYLESWNDTEPKKNTFCLTQPTINTIFKTRQAQVTLMRLLEEKGEFYNYIQSFWKENIYKKAKEGSFESFWNQSLHDGFFSSSVEAKSYKVEKGAVSAAASGVSEIKGGGNELVLYAKVGIADGSMAANPWLQELPDPVSKICWDNYVCISKAQADKLGVKDEDVVIVKANGASVKLPVFILPGQTNETIAIAYGYGRTQGAKMFESKDSRIGENVFPMSTFVNGSFTNFAANVTIEKTTEKYELAATQTHHTIMGRTEDIIQEYTLSHFAEGKIHKHEHSDLSLWNTFPKEGHYWGMVIDLSACTGCGACVVSCQAENNISVVGKAEIKMRREMHWIRIDRYFSADVTNSTDAQHFGVKTEETIAENPEVTFQPMMCQHCDNAPCETVCPVMAIAHSSEGLNQQVYNRCVGTRYCANNCPYKVRRFNWFDYTNPEVFIYNPVDDLGKMVLNPDVTVRARGTMEKCSMCVQRLQAGKLKAKIEGKPLVDGEIQTACAQSCPANAIIFGDLNDKNSQISKYYKADRTFKVIEEVKTRPHVGYMAKIRNKAENKKA